MYARRLTKEELLNAGITEVTSEGRVFKGDHEEVPKVNNGGYFFHFIYDLDKQGNRIKIPSESSAFGYVYKQRTVGLHRLMWAWFNDEVPAGMVVDHINNKHENLEDYDLSNLQLLTPSENIRKNMQLSTVELPCKIDRPRSYYEDKLLQFTQKYEAAKEAGDVKLCHKLRCQLHQYRAKLRYWDSHEKEHNAAVEKKDLVRQLRGYASYAKHTGAMRTWHMLNSVVKGNTYYTNEQLKQLIDDMVAWAVGAGGLV